MAPKTLEERVATGLQHSRVFAHNFFQTFNADEQGAALLEVLKTFEDQDDADFNAMDVLTRLKKNNQPEFKQLIADNFIAINQMANDPLNENSAQGAMTLTGYAMTALSDTHQEMAFGTLFAKLNKFSNINDDQSYVPRTGFVGFETLERLNDSTKTLDSLHESKKTKDIYLSAVADHFNLLQHIARNGDYTIGQMGAMRILRNGFGALDEFQQIDTVKILLEKIENENPFTRSQTRLMLADIFQHDDKYKDAYQQAALARFKELYAVAANPAEKYSPQARQMAVQVLSNISDKLDPLQHKKTSEMLGKICNDQSQNFNLRVFIDNNFNLKTIILAASMAFSSLFAPKAEAKFPDSQARIVTVTPAKTVIASAPAAEFSQDNITPSKGKNYAR